MTPFNDLTYRVLTDTHGTAATERQSSLQEVQASLVGSPNSPLIFALDSQGCFLSLAWPLAEQYGVNLERYIGRSLLQRLTASRELSLEALLAGDLSASNLTDTWTLQLEECQLTGQASLTLLQPADSACQLMGAIQVSQISRSGVLRPTPWRLGYRSQLTQFTWNIRRTLDLETIWQQTTDGLSTIFDVEWCGICPYTLHSTDVRVVAEVANTPGQTRRGETLVLAEYPSFREALRARRPVVSKPLGHDVEASETLLIAATNHHNEPNGLILLQATEGTRWDDLDCKLFQEVVQQIGTAIAHAYLFRDAQGLADELQAANQRLRQKHRELEEARHQAEEASRLKSEFLANTSHELRTPLNGMIGFLKLILDGMADDPEEQQEFLQEAHKSAIHLLNLINDVLDIAKIEAGKMQIDMAPVKVRELFLDVENFTRPQAEQKGLGFEIVVPPTRDEIIVNGNYQRLLQVILNLVGNAIKFTHEGSITISAEIKSQKIEFQDHEWPGIVKVSVADTGIGVSLEKQDRLFQTFSQVDGERTRQYGGTGLGLAISQRLVEAMGGVVQFISMGEGLGSTVTFTTLLYQEPVMIE
ncbi:MAG: GAF domain-containing protein [Leptolyngbya sp. SIO1E4]|nr:GAF domain-containing protein [Leptolyngbya sp. SIO1E4]